MLRPLPGLASVPSVPATTVPELEPGGRFLTGTYTGAAGTRGYKLYVPSGYAGQAVPLVVMLHGCGQAADDSAAGTRLNWLTEQVSWLVVYPEQAAAANPSRCWNWFQAVHQGHVGVDQPQRALPDHAPDVAMLEPEPLSPARRRPAADAATPRG